MGTFNEADHPRDDEGKFTFKGGGTTSSVNSENKMQNRANILFDSMKDKLSESYKKGISEIKNGFNNLTTPIADNIIDKHYNNVKWLAEKIGIDAAENLDMAFEEHYLDTPFARQHKVLNNANELNPILREPVKERIYKQLADDYGKDCINTTKGIYFENYSRPSKRIAQSKSIKEYIQNNKQYLKDYGYLKKGDVGFSGFTEFNLWGAIGKAQIAEMYLEKSGEITFYLIDTYDFNKKEDYFPVKAGRLNQERGRLKPYFSVYSVKIDKETASKYLK